LHGCDGYNHTETRLTTLRRSQLNNGLSVSFLRWLTAPILLSLTSRKLQLRENHLHAIDQPHESIPGIILASASLIVMPLLVRAKRKVARGIKSGALMADSKQTELCTYLSAILLAGLLLNALVGWWWADPVAALIMVPIIVKEGIEGLRGENCCDDD